MTDEKVGAIGEFALVERIRQVLPAAVAGSANLAVGIGDDTAVWQPHAGEQILITTDALIEGVHFDLDWQNWESLGWKSLAVNISDIAAMGGEPAVATISIALPANIPVGDVMALYEGVASIAKAFGVVIAGGDVVGSPAAVMIGVTVLGNTRGGRFLSRSGAKPGDVIAVSGTLGAAAAGLKLLQLPADDARRQATTAAMLIDAFLLPIPRVALGQLLLDLGATSAMDLSDGLLSDLPKILEASNVAGVLDVDKVPAAAAIRALFPADWQELALWDGEDYELLFTAPNEAMSMIALEAERHGQTVTVIGAISEHNDDEELLSLIDQQGHPVTVPGGGFDHFRKP